MYGSEADWVKNTLAAGTARLRIGDDQFDLVSPRLVTKEVAWQQLPAGTKPPPKLFRVTEFLQVDTTERACGLPTPNPTATRFPGSSHAMV